MLMMQKWHKLKDVNQTQEYFNTHVFLKILKSLQYMRWYTLHNPGLCIWQSGQSRQRGRQVKDTLIGGNGGYHRKINRYFESTEWMSTSSTRVIEYPLV